MIFAAFPLRTESSPQQNDKNSHTQRANHPLCAKHKCDWTANILNENPTHLPEEYFFIFRVLDEPR